MSGGSCNYLYSKLANDLTDYEAPSGHYGIDNEESNPCYKKDIGRWRKLNPMHDRELSEMMYDVSCLLHSLEWLESGDICYETYKDDVKAFKKKWYQRTYPTRYECYKDDIRCMLKELEDEMYGESE